MKQTEHSEMISCAIDLASKAVQAEII